jgi:CRP/FNR family transcriptional regulator, anaerobic regulatory protein
MEELIAFLNWVATAEGWPLSEKCLAWLANTIQTVEIKKNDYILRPGEVNRNMYFITSGLLKCYYILDGKMVCDWFFGKKELVVSVDSFYDQKASDDFMRALERCVLHYISYDQLNYAYRNFVEFNVCGRVLTNKYLRIWHQHARNLRRLDAEQRYLFLKKTRPELDNRVPVQDLASFLGVSRETLSRMRGRY